MTVCLYIIIITDLVPYDGVQVIKTVTIHLSVIVVIIAMAFLGIVFTVFCLAFNFVYRKSK